MKPTLGAHLEDQEQRIQSGEAVEVDSTQTINALCLRFSTEAKPVRKDHNKYMASGELLS